MKTKQHSLQIKKKTIISTLMLKEDRISDYIQDGKVTLLNGYEINNSLRIGMNYRSLITHLRTRGGTKANRLYLIVDRQENYNHLKNSLILAFSNEAVIERGWNILEVITTKDQLLQLGVGFSKEKIESLQANGFNVIPQFISQKFISKKAIEYKFKQLESIKNIHTIAFTDAPITGNKELLKTLKDFCFSHNKMIFYDPFQASKDFKLFASTHHELIIKSRHITTSLFTSLFPILRAIHEDQAKIIQLKLDTTDIQSNKLLPSFYATLDQLKTMLEKTNVVFTKTFIHNPTKIISPSKNNRYYHVFGHFTLAFSFLKETVQFSKKMIRLIFLSYLVYMPLPFFLIIFIFGREHYVSYP